VATITQDMRFRQSVCLWALKHGVTSAAIRYHTNRQYVYRWLRRYDGDIHSLANHSRRPHHHPNQQTESETLLINNMRRRNPHTGLVRFWVKLRKRGYTRSISTLYRFLIRTSLMAEKLPNPKYVAKPYEQMRYPGERFQIDVKFVPEACLAGQAKGEHFFQFTAIDEYSRWRYVEAFDEKSTYTAALFLDHLIKAFPMRIECVQTDNGSEFTKRLLPQSSTSPTMFEARLAEYGIRHKLIKPATPRHNGKVERSHRKDNEIFYATHSFYSLEDFSKQLKRYNYIDYNCFPMRPLGWKTPQEALYDFIRYGVTYV